MNHFSIFRTALLAIFLCSGMAVHADTIRYSNDAVSIYLLDTETKTVELEQCREWISRAIVPEHIVYGGEEYTVTRLGKDCFSGCSGMTSVELPSSVVGLGGYCFQGIAVR